MAIHSTDAPFGASDDVRHLPGYQLALKAGVGISVAGACALIFLVIYLGSALVNCIKVN